MIRINLLADRQAKDRLIIQQQIMLGFMVFIGALVLCAGWWQVKSSQIKSTNQQIVNAKQELEKQKKIRKQVAELQKREDKVKAILAAIDSLLKIKKGPTPYFDALNKMLPAEIWLTSLTDTSGKINLQGYAFSNPSIAQLMKRMEKSKHYTGVDLQEIVNSKFSGETLKRFKISSMTTLGKQLAEEKKKREAAKKKAKGKKKRKKKR
jgi:Tfp pilus assembly protein PilN